MHPNTIVIPQPGKSLIAEVKEDDINIVGSFETHYNSISKITDSGMIATLNKAARKLMLHTLQGELLRTVNVPFAQAINTKGAIVYIGGDATNGEVCYMLNMENAESTLQNITLPEPMTWGKAVDDILILGNRMILLDDFIFPKYIFTYDISMPNSPKWLHTKKLPEDRPNEHIIKGDINERWMVYLSIASSFDGKESHITLERDGHTHTITSKHKDGIQDICLMKETLYVISHNRLGMFDLSKKIQGMRDLQYIDHTVYAERILKVSDDKIIIAGRYGYELLDLENPAILSREMLQRHKQHFSLDLQIKGLTELTREHIGDPSRLVKLNLYMNELQTFPEILRECTQLRILNIGYNKFKTLPKWLPELENLEQLDLSGNKIGKSALFNLRPFKFPKNLKYLDLGDCGLLHIPSDIYRLKKLEYLKLRNNFLFWLPKKLFTLTNLRMLDVNWNIRFDPENVQQLTKMTQIKISNSRTGLLPDFVYMLTQLEELDASDANIKFVSGEISSLVNLEVLNLSQNKLESLPDEIGELHNLRILDLCNCGLSEIPSFIFRMKRLERIDLCDNQILNITKDHFKDMPNLVQVNIYGNPIKKTEKGAPNEPEAS